MQRALIFDFGGVLMKTVDYAPRHAWDARLGLPLGSVERAVHNDESWVLAQTGRLPIADYWADVAARLGITPQQTRQLALDFYSGDTLDKGLVDLIRDLRAKGHPVALLSNDSVELADKLARLGIAGLFDPLVISAHIGVMKPQAGAYEAVLARLDVPAQAAIFIDDRLENITGAQALGIHTIHYTIDTNLPLLLTELLHAQ